MTATFLTVHGDLTQADTRRNAATYLAFLARHLPPAGATRLHDWHRQINGTWRDVPAPRDVTLHGRFE